MRAPWPTTWRMTGHIAVAGLLIIGIYSAATFYAISHVFSPGTCALIVALQLIIIAIVSGFLFKQTITFKQWIGLLSGLLGVDTVDH